MREKSVNLSNRWYVHRMDGPGSVLRALREIAERRRNDDQVEKEAVLAGRRAGVTWEDMAKALGRTRSALWQKYHKLVQAECAEPCGG